MKDINYFLDAEASYTEPQSIWCENGLTYPSDPLQFLGGRCFSRVKDPAKGANYEQYGLTDTEILIFQFFVETKFSYRFRGDIYKSSIPELVKEMRAVLESVISKAPVFEGNILFRFCKENDPSDFKEGDIYEPPHSLTTTQENWEKDGCTYIISVLPVEKTKAHSIYKLYNCKEEFQVNFQTGAKFRIDKIVEESDRRKLIYMTEIE